MTIDLGKYVRILAGVGGTQALPFEVPTFDTQFPSLLLARGGPLLLARGGPLLLEKDSSNG